MTDIKIDALGTLNEHTGDVCDIVFSADDRRLLTCSADNISTESDGKVLLWDIAQRRSINAFAIPRDRNQGFAVGNAALSADGRAALYGNGDGIICVWDTESGNLLHRFDLPGTAVRSIAVSPDGRRALSGDDDWGNGAEIVRRIRLWDLERGAQIGLFEGHEGYVQDMIFLPDGENFLSASNDKTIRLWNLNSGRETRRFKGHREGVSTISLSPDGRSFLSGSDDKTVRLWNLENIRSVLQIKAHSIRVFRAAFKPDGRQALSASVEWARRERGHRLIVNLWNLENGEEIRRFIFPGHAGASCIRFSHNGRLVVCSSKTGEIKTYELT